MNIIPVYAACTKFSPFNENRSINSPHLRYYFNEHKVQNTMHTDSIFDVKSRARMHLARYLKKP